MIGQISSSFSNLLYHGIKINHFPGEYPQALKVNLISDTACKLEFSTSGLNISKTKNSCSFDVKQTVQISLRLCKKGVWLDTIYTGTYIIGKKSDLPVVCLNLKRENFDLPDGIITGGIKPAEPPDSGSVTYGRVWKKESIPVFVEYYEKGKAPYAAMLRVKPFGGMTISMPEVSLRLITDSAFGPKKIKFSPFLNKKFNSYKSLVLRTSGNDQAITRIKDITLSSVARDLKLDYMDYRQAVLYVNGEYWGIYNIREKVNHEFLQYNHGASKDPMQTKIDITGIGLPEYQEMLDYVKRPFEEKNVINEINKKLVFENYIDYIILEIHIINIDSRGNVRFWKSKNLDNRWRWIYFDGDQSCFPYQVDFNYLQKRLSTTYIEWCNPDWVTVTLRNLLTHKSTKNFFINEYCLLMGTRLNKDTLINRVNLFAGNIRPEIPAHVMRRNRISYQTVENWENEIEKFKDFFRKREQTAYKHLRETFSLSGQLKNLQISSNINGLKAIRLQHSSYLFDRAEAKFFTDIPVSFEAVEINPKYKFSKWEMPEIDTTKICTLNVGKVEKLKAIFERVPFSQYKNGLRISFIAKKESKKDSIYILGIANRSGKRLDNLKLFLKNTTEKNVLEFELDSLQNEDIFFVSNNSAEAEKLTGKEFRIKKVMFPSRFNFSNSEWVLLDRNGNIIDSLSLGLNDSVFSGKKTTYFYRDEKSNTWKFSGKFLKKEKAVVIKNESVFNKLLLVAASVFFVLIVILIYRKKKRKNLLSVLIVFFLIKNLDGQNVCIDKFGLEDEHIKLVNNKGVGCKNLNGCRNVRVVLKNLLYRGGNNHPSSFQNPLQLTTIAELRKLDFDRAIYLYDKNFDSEFPITRLDSLKLTGFNYQSHFSFEEKSIYNFMFEIKQSADKQNPKLIYIHCWNGWHQSGRLSAMVLIQFCNYSVSKALKYWEENTDGNSKGYKKVKESIRKFKPFEELKFSKEQKDKYCPCKNM